MFTSSNMKVPVDHPLVDIVSVLNETGSYSGSGTSEIAFFNKGKWVLTLIPEFAEYSESVACDTRVYVWVPNGLVRDFVDKYRATDVVL